jgi:hypothetical protein
MADAFNKDHQTTTSRDVAVLAHYLGYPFVRVETSTDYKNETFTLRVPSFDFEIVTKEAGSDATNVCFASLQKSNAFIGSKIGYARKNGGTWSSFSKK